ncbi:hypothetical protein BJY26_001797 [Spelaeicoccus albus]|uniref:Uncharacterized protein n=1 Tax=Spelaeicoccus albus TaxID=1280376 RepID=A0A7Z0IH86_9MICO|nr:hypothetical protein [Spelaeicoccus albus]
MALLEMVGGVRWKPNLPVFGLFATSTMLKPPVGIGSLAAGLGPGTHC